MLHLGWDHGKNCVSGVIRTGLRPTRIYVESERTEFGKCPYRTFAVSVKLAAELRREGIPEPRGLFDAIWEVLGGQDRAIEVAL